MINQDVFIYHATATTMEHDSHARQRGEIGLNFGASDVHVSHAWRDTIASLLCLSPPERRHHHASSVVNFVQIDSIAPDAAFCSRGRRVLTTRF